ncbi:Meiosis regulator and mRNA stability factor 1, partial [Araneus ventricosus]
DINFCPFLAEFRYMKKVNIILIHNAASNYLLNICNENFPFSLFTEDLPPRRVEKPLQPAQLMVTGLPQKMSETLVRKILLQLTDNSGGKVLSVTGSTAVIKFASTEYAVKAKGRIENEKIGKRKIKVAFRKNLPVHTPTTETFDESIDSGDTSLNIDENKKNKRISLLGAPTGLDVNRRLTRAFAAENQQSRRPLPTGLEGVNIGSGTSGISTRHYGQTDSSNSEDDEPQRNKKSKRLKKRRVLCLDFRIGHFCLCISACICNMKMSCVIPATSRLQVIFYMRIIAQIEKKM